MKQLKPDKQRDKIEQVKHVKEVEQAKQNKQGMNTRASTIDVEKYLNKTPCLFRWVVCEI